MFSEVNTVLDFYQTLSDFAVVVAYHRTQRAVGNFHFESCDHKLCLNFAIFMAHQSSWFRRKKAQSDISNPCPTNRTFSATFLLNVMQKGLQFFVEF